MKTEPAGPATCSSPGIGAFTLIPSAGPRGLRKSRWEPGTWRHGTLLRPCWRSRNGRSWTHDPRAAGFRVGVSPATWRRVSRHGARGGRGRGSCLQVPDHREAHADVGEGLADRAGVALALAVCAARAFFEKQCERRRKAFPLTRAEIMRPVSAAHGRRQLLATREGQLAGAHVCQPRLRRPLGMMALFPGSLVSSPSGST